MAASKSSLLLLNFVIERRCFDPFIAENWVCIQLIHSFNAIPSRHFFLFFFYVLDNTHLRR